jgi:predicted transcriptional regulator
VSEVCLIAPSLTLYYPRLMKDTTISFKLEQGLKTKLVALAKAENRSLSNFIEKVLKEELAKHESRPSRPKTGA